MQCIDVHGQLSHPGLDIGYEGDPHVATKRGIKQSAKKGSAANLPVWDDRETASTGATYEA